MSSAEIIDVDAVELDDDAATPAGKSRGKWPLLAGVAAVLLLGAGGGGAYYLTAGKAHPEKEKKAAASGEASDKNFVDVPPIIVNLRSADGRAHLLKLHFMLVASDVGQVDAVKAKLPVFIDALQPFLRELRPEDLNGSAAVYRAKEEMLSRASDAFGDGTVHDILIQDLIQQ